MSDARQMPQYQSHKKVRALKILKVHDPTKPGDETDRGRELYFCEPGFASIHVNHEWIRTKRPEAGGYFVQYEDGYTSYSPAGPFEEGYTLIK